jgi:hypothetical protein
MLKVHGESWVRKITEDTSVETAEPGAGLGFAFALADTIKKRVPRPLRSLQRAGVRMRA